ncbi:MAG: hypothetical protein GY793_03260 [Proteobacteria bacterium]|nr:hypothetical protein [Pseudomonadota bacterium]
MLDKIRRNALHNKTFKLMLGLAVLAFAALGMGSDISPLSFSKNYAMKVGSIEITPKEYYKAYQMAKMSLQQSMGGENVPAELLGFFKPKMTAKINQDFSTKALIENFANEESILVSEKTVMELLKKEKAFQKDGKFDKKTYIAALRQAQINPIDFEKQMVKNMQQVLISNMFFDSVNISKTELDMEVQHTQARKDIQVLSLVNKDVRNLTKPNKEELETVYKENSSEFVIPEKRTFNFLALSRDSINKANSATEEEAKTYYEENADTYFSKREFNVKQILVQDEKTANEVVAIKDLNQNFTKYVKQYSVDEISKKKGGDMGWLTADIFSDEVADVLNTTEKGKTSTKSVKSPFGFHIFKIADVKEPVQKPFIKVKANILATLNNEKLEVVLKEKEDEILDRVSAGESLKTIAEQLDVKLKTIEKVTAKTPGGYIKTVFNTALDEVSEPIELEFDAIGWVEVTSIHEESAKPFADVEKRLKALFQKQKLKELLDEKAEFVLKDIKDNNVSFTKIAKKYRIVSPIKTVISLARANNNDKKIANNVAEAVFKADGKSVLNTVLVNGDELVIVKVLESYQEDISEDAKTKLAEQLKQQKVNDMYYAFLSSLQQKHSVDINEKLIDRITSQ